MFFTFLWGANFILAEIALHDMAPISFSVSRFAMGGIAMILVLCIQYQDTARNMLGLASTIPAKDWGRILVISIVGATLAPWLGIEGLALGPVISSGFGYLLSTEKINNRGYWGILLAAVGTLILALDGIQPGEGYWLGDLFLIAALALTVIELHLIKPMAKKYGSIPMVTLRTTIGGIIYFFIALPSLAREPWFSLGMWTWIAILVGGFIGVGFGQWVKVRALKKLRPTQVVLYGNLVPLAALLIAWLSTGKNPSLLESISGFFIISGAVCIQTIGTRSVSKNVTDWVSS